VNIWVVENYPYAPPSCYITPTSDMIIKSKHRHVDSNGVVYLPYLSSWNPTGCSLGALVATMAQVFGIDPPVRSQPKPTTNQSNPIPTGGGYGNSVYPGSTPSQYPPYPNSNSTPNNLPSYSNSTPSNLSSYPNSTPPYAQPPNNANNFPYQANSQYSQPQSQYPSIPPQYPNNNFPPQNQYPPQFQSNQPFEDPAIVAKRNAIRTTTEKIQARMQDYFSKTTKEIDNLMAENAKLEEQSKNILSQKTQVEQQQAQATMDIENLTKSFDDINKWLEVNDRGSTIDIDALTEPKDPLSKQLLYLVAEDATIEDTLYYLEKNLMSGELTLETFLKNSRNLSTEQFLKRATIRRIHERQKGQTAAVK